MPNRPMTTEDFFALSKALGAVPDTSDKPLFRNAEHHTKFELEGRTFVLGFRSAASSLDSAEGIHSTLYLSMLASEEDRGNAIPLEKWTEGTVPPEVRAKGNVPVLMQPHNRRFITLSRLMMDPSSIPKDTFPRWTKTGDRDFDNKVLTELSPPQDPVSPNPEGLVVYVLRAPETRTIILSLLFDLGWDVIQLGGKRSLIMLTSKSMPPNALERVRKSIQALIHLTEQMPALVTDMSPEAQERSKREQFTQNLGLKMIGGLFLGILVFAGPVYLAMEHWLFLSPWKPLSMVAGIAVPLSIAAFLGLLWVLHKNGRMPKWRGAAFLFVLMLANLAAATYLGMVIIDCALDKAPPKVITYKVTKLKFYKKYHHGTTSSDYFHATGTPLGGGKSLVLDVSENQLRRLRDMPKEQRYLSITVHPGLLGIAWRKTPRIVPPPPPRERRK